MFTNECHFKNTTQKKRKEKASVKRVFKLMTDSQGNKLFNSQLKYTDFYDEVEDNNHKVISLNLWKVARANVAVLYMKIYQQYFNELIN